MAEFNSVRVLQICNIPPSASPESISLPLTFFDTFWIKFSPVERLFFYPLPHSDPPFIDSVLQKLKHSLSLTLDHFLPLAGNLIWPQHSPKPIILYNPNDAVSLTIAQTDADFNHISSRHVREAKESRPLVPELPPSDTQVPVMALQITMFSNPVSGLCIGMTSHHAVLDGKISIMFIKSWAYFCKLSQFEEQSPRLLTELTPYLDRTVIKDPTGNGLDLIYLEAWQKMAGSGLKYLPNIGVPPDVVRATLELTRADIEKIRKNVLLHLMESNEEFRLSSFVLTYAYALTCIVKAERMESQIAVYLGFVADYRSRLRPPIPSNYFGNCGVSHGIKVRAREVMGEDGVAVIAKRMKDEILDLEKNGAERVREDRLSAWESLEPGSKCFGVAGSPRFGIYEVDFGWGRPELVEVASLDRTGSISMAESRDGNGGVEIGFVLSKDAMLRLVTLFHDDLKAM